MSQLVGSGEGVGVALGSGSGVRAGVGVGDGAGESDGVGAGLLVVVLPLESALESSPPALLNGALQAVARITASAIKMAVLKELLQRNTGFL